MKEETGIAFILRVINNQIRAIIHRNAPRFEKGPKSQLQGGILGFLYHHRDGPVYQRDIEKEFRVSRATATNTLQVMERDGLIVRQAMDRDARLKRIQLTEEAFANHSQIEAHMEIMERRMTAGMSREDMAQLRRLLGNLLKNLEDFAAELDEDPDAFKTMELPEDEEPEADVGRAAGLTEEAPPPPADDGVIPDEDHIRGG